MHIAAWDFGRIWAATLAESPIAENPKQGPPALDGKGTIKKLDALLCHDMIPIPNPYHLFQSLFLHSFLVLLSSTPHGIVGAVHK